MIDPALVLAACAVPLAGAAAGGMIALLRSGERRRVRVAGFGVRREFRCPCWDATGGTCCPGGTVREDCPGRTIEIRDNGEAR